MTLSAPPFSIASYLLAGDIGGTKSHLALFLAPHGEENGEHGVEDSVLFTTRSGLRCVKQERYITANFSSLEALAREFLTPNELGSLVAACFGVPGPVQEGRVHLTNVHWVVEQAQLVHLFQTPRVYLMNDLAANAQGLMELQSKDFEVLHLGALHSEGNRCVISPGTGLGEAGLYWDGRGYQVWACEGGHAGFAPRSALQMQLLQALQKRFGHVSVERVVSGQGLENIYQFLRDQDPDRENPQVAAALQSDDPGYVITRAAKAKVCELCQKTLELFATSLAQEAADFALKSLATGGVYLGGGIPAKVLWKLKEPQFVAAFLDQGRMKPLMESMPLAVVLNEQAALLGAARVAAQGETREVQDTKK